MQTRQNIPITAASLERIKRMVEGTYRSVGFFADGILEDTCRVVGHHLGRPLKSFEELSEEEVPAVINFLSGYLKEDSARRKEKLFSDVIATFTRRKHE